MFESLNVLPAEAVSVEPLKVTLQEAPDDNPCSLNLTVFESDSKLPIIVPAPSTVAFVEVEEVEDIRIRFAKVLQSWKM